MGEGGGNYQENIFQKAAGWVADKMGGFPSISTDPEDYYLVDKKLDPKPTELVAYPDLPTPLHLELAKQKIHTAFHEGTDHLKLLFDNQKLWSTSVEQLGENEARIKLDVVEGADTIKDGEVVKLKPEIARNYQNLDEIDLPAETNDGVPIYYRGISQAELKYIVENGQLMGAGDMTYKEEKLKGTFLYTPIARRDALGYATKGRLVDQATLTEPKFLIGVTIPDSANISRPDEFVVGEEAEVVIHSPISVDNITRIYECRALEMKSGFLELTRKSSDDPFRSNVNYLRNTLPTATQGIRELDLDSLIKTI